MAWVSDFELTLHFSKASQEFSRFVASILNKGSINFQDRQAIHERAKEEGISIYAIDAFLNAQLEELATDTRKEKKRRIEEVKKSGRVWDGELQTQFSNASIEFSRFVASVLNKHAISDQDREAIHERAAEEGISIKGIDVFLDAQLKELLKQAEINTIKEEAEIVDRFSKTLEEDPKAILDIDIHGIKRAENLNHLLNIITEKLGSIRYDFMTNERLKQKDVLLQKHVECINLIKINYPNDERFASLHSQEDIENYVEKQQKKRELLYEVAKQRQKKERDEALAKLKKFLKKYGIYILLFYVILAALIIIFN